MSVPTGVDNHLLLINRSANMSKYSVKQGHPKGWFFYLLCEANSYIDNRV